MNFSLLVATGIFAVNSLSTLSDFKRPSFHLVFVSGERVSSLAAWISTCMLLGEGTRQVICLALKPITLRQTNGITFRLFHSRWLHTQAPCTMGKYTSQVWRYTSSKQWINQTFWDVTNRCRYSHEAYKWLTVLNSTVHVFWTLEQLLFFLNVFNLT